jgi:hypothetical protein
MPGLLVCGLLLYISLLYKTDAQQFPPLFFCIVQLDLSERNGITLEVCVAVVSTRAGCARSHPHPQTPTPAYMRT